MDTEKKTEEQMNDGMRTKKKQQQQPMNKVRNNSKANQQRKKCKKKIDVLTQTCTPKSVMMETI